MVSQRKSERRKPRSKFLSGTGMVIGIDLDNTLICYEDVFWRLAEEAGLLAGGVPVSQKAVREIARRSPEGDIAWQRLQGLAYGPRIGDAQLAPGALAFLDRCRAAAIPVGVVSHKTRFAAQDPTRTDLRRAALEWMEEQGLFGPGTGLEPKHCHFADTRKEKIAQMVALGCTHFIDDLLETFREPTFPVQMRAILYAPGSDDGLPVPAAVRKVRSWTEIEHLVLAEGSASGQKLPS
jgi:hypothetical protein